MTRSGSIPLTLSSLFQLFTILLLLLIARCHGASQPITKTTEAAATVTTTKATNTATTRKGRLKGGRRKKQWRRRAQDYGEARQTPTTTFVTNPSSLNQNGESSSSSSGKGGKGGKGGKIIHKEEDYDGRTTIMIKCDQEMKARNRKHAKGPPGTSTSSGIARGGPASTSSGSSGKGGKGGSLKFGTKASTFSGGSGRDPASAAEVNDICDEYYDEISGGGGWNDGDGEGGTGTAGDGSGTGGNGSGTGGDGTNGVDGQVHGDSSPGNPSGGDYPPYDEETGQISNGVDYYDDLSSCAAIGAGNAATKATDSTEEVTVTLDVVHEIEPNSQDGGSRSILNLMRADLQENVAPVIADCVTEFGISPSGTSPFEDAYATDGSSVGSGSGTFGTGSGSFGDGTGNSGTGGPWNDATLITNANFNSLKDSEIDCSSYSKVFEPTNTKYKCIETTIPVDLFYDGTDTSDFDDRVQTAIDGHKWDVPGLMMTSTVRDSGTSDNSITAIEGDKNEEHEPIGPGGFIMIAAAAMVLMLLFLMLVRRKRRDEMVKHVSLEDDDDTYLKDIEQESNASVASLNRLANVVGEDGESVNSGWTGASTHFRNAANANGSMDAMFSNTEARPSHQDVHVCSSATCEVCERNRRGGVQFIPSGTTCMPVSMPPAPLPPDGPREYTAEDTVTL